MASGQTNANERIVQTVEARKKQQYRPWLWPEKKKHKNAGPRLGGPIIKQPTFNWEAEDKYSELKNFRLEVNNIFKSYSTPQEEQIAIIKIG